MKYKLNHWLLIVTVLLFVAGCTTMKSSWEGAQLANTISAYESFLKKYPEGALAEQARRKIKQMRYEKAGREDTVEAYEEFLRGHPRGNLAIRAKERIDILIIEQRDFQNAVANGSIEALKEFLSKYPKSKHRWVIHEKLIEKICELRERGDRVAENILVNMLIEYLSKVEGQREITVGYLPGGGITLMASSFDGGIRHEIIKALGQIGTKASVPILIRCLKDPERSILYYGIHLTRGLTGPATYCYLIRDAAEAALKKITGRDFGQDQERWRQWWEENKDRF